MNESKSAFAAIVGKANVGKSSILNRLIGSKIAIVSGKPQTTRTKIMGVLTTDDNVQLVFTDTPGFFKPKDKLGEYTTVYPALKSAYLSSMRRIKSLTPRKRSL